MHVLVEAKREPVQLHAALLLASGCRHVVRAEIFVATHHSRTCFDAVHREVNGEVQKGKPPHRRIDEADNRQSAQSVHQAVQRQRGFPSGRTKLALHVVVLQDEVGNEVLQVEGEPQQKNCGNHYLASTLFRGALLQEAHVCAFPHTSFRVIRFPQFAFFTATGSLAGRRNDYE